MIRLIGLTVLVAWAFTSTHLGLAIEYMVGRSGEHLMSHVEVLFRMLFGLVGLGRDGITRLKKMRHLTFVQIVSAILTQIAATMLPARQIPGDNGETVAEPYKDVMSATFVYLFLFRYIQLVVHIISFDVFYRVTATPRTPNIQRGDVTVILPLEDPENPYFGECIQSCLVNEPGMIVVVPVGDEHAIQVKKAVSRYQQQNPHTKITVKPANDANRRLQIAHGLRYVTSRVTVLMDEHVIWPSARFLPTLLAPLEDGRVGIVGTNKRARRTDTGYFWNTLGALDLERQDFEDRAANAIDGGISAISGLTSAHRTRILTDSVFLEDFTNEKFFFNTFGPLSTDSDSFITRWTLQGGYSAKTQSSDDACIEVVLPRTFLKRCVEESRTSWRTGLAYLFSAGPPIYHHPWSLYALHLSSFVNVDLVYDGILIYTLSMSPMSKELNALSYLIRWMLVCKIVKFIPYFVLHPQDLVMLPASIVFGYIHSFLKLYAGLTCFITTTDPNTKRIFPVLPAHSASSSPSLSSSSRAFVSSPRQPQPGPGARSRSRMRDNYQDNRYAQEEVFDLPEASSPRGRGRPRSTPDPMQSIEEETYVAPKRQPAAKGRGRPKKR
ncbi:hypothetical protein BJX70DRAFT_402747 [Aspergillus crustosus]